MKNRLLNTIQLSMRLFFRAAPWYTMGLLVISIVAAILSTLLTKSNNYLFDKVGLIVGGGRWDAVLTPLLLTGCVFVLRQLFRLFQQYLRRVTDRTVQNRLKIHVQDSVRKLEAIDFENPDVLNRIDKADKGRASCTEFCMALFDMLASQLPYFVSMGIYLYSLRPALAFSILILALPTLITYLIQGKLFVKLEDEISPYRRRNAYYDRCISDREYFKETRLLGAYNYFFKQFSDSLHDYCDARARVEKRNNMNMITSRVITLGGYVGVLLLLFSSLMEGMISIGAFAAVFASITELMYSMRDLFDRDFNGAMRSYGSVRNFISFIDSFDKSYSPSQIVKRSAIQLQDVRFSYPGTEKETIRGISLSIEPGDTIAIVGENGAGKSTLMRLILGEYTASKGKVLADGLDLSEVAPADRYKNVSAVFQHFGKYQMTLRENIELSSIEKDEDSFSSAMEQADVSLDRSFPDRENTLLSREFGGVDISGGQWQRVAIARGLYRQHELIVLDEPTAAIDPIEETRLYKQFALISKDVTALIVTHRLGSARIADRIIVMKDGLIDDMGTHDELVEKRGHYADLYQAQAKWYA